jgi:hypothetical protein
MSELANSGDSIAQALPKENADGEKDISKRTKPRFCKFYASGQCKKGSSCPFSHEGSLNTNFHSGAVYSSPVQVMIPPGVPIFSVVSENYTFKRCVKMTSFPFSFVI